MQHAFRYEKALYGLPGEKTPNRVGHWVACSCNWETDFADSPEKLDPLVVKHLMKVGLAVGR